MRVTQVRLTGIERTFAEHEIIVSKTDPRGVITYANDVFLRVAGLTEEEAIGQPHSLIRHPDMPRAVFKLLWDTLKDGHEIFAYVLNMARDGDHYWVLAHVTPSYDQGGRLVGYHSSRRKPDAAPVAAAGALYAVLRAVERQHESSPAGLDASWQLMLSTLADRGQTYEEFVWELINGSRS